MSTTQASNGIEPGAFAPVAFLNQPEADETPAKRPSTKTLAERIEKAATLEAQAAELRKQAERERAEVEDREARLVRAKAKLNYLTNSREAYAVRMNELRSGLNNLRLGVVSQITSHLPTTTASGKVLSPDVYGSDTIGFITEKYREIALAEAMTSDAKRVLGALDDAIASAKAEVAELEA